jgi:hypothetical protein
MDATVISVPVMAGVVEGAGVDALNRPDAERDGEYAEEPRGIGGISTVVLATAKQVHEPRREREHPGGDKKPGREQPRDRAAY